MERFEDLKTIWQNEKAENLPEPEEIKSAIAQYKKSKKRNVILLLAIAILLLPVIILILIYAPLKNWTIVFGEVLILIGFILTVILKLKNLKKTTESEMLSNEAFLKSLEKSTASKPRTNFLQIFGIITISVGYGFFIFENIKDNPHLLLLIYSSIAIFVLGMYFIFRPFAQRKSKEKSQRLIENIAKMKKQF